MLKAILIALEEAFIDTLKILPILLLVYLLVSYFEHNSHKFVKTFNKAKNFGPIIGASLGSVPQCGFSVVMADMYNKKSITLGTLIAVFVATSDEAIPILFSNYNYIGPMVIMVAIKFIYAIFCGYLIDLITCKFKKKTTNNFEQLNSTMHTPCECGHENHDHEHYNSCCADNIFIDAIKHALNIALYIFVVNFILTLLSLKLDLSTLLNNIPILIQPLITSLIGLFPNCAASVVLVELYMIGGLSYGSLLAGLATGAGVGLLMLFKCNKKAWAKNLLILGLMYLLGVLLGLTVNLISILV